MSAQFTQEIWRIISLAVLAVLAGLFLDNVALVVLVVTLGYLGWHLFNVWRLVSWLQEGKKYAPPISKGLWGEIFTDIYTLQKRNRKRRKRLVKFLQRFRETTEALPDGVVVLREFDDIEWWNEAAGKLLDLRYPQDVGQRIVNLIRDPEFTSFFQQEDKSQAFRLGSPGHDQRILSFRVVPYGKNQNMLLVRDVTILEQVDQMRRDFVANISHELRTPLTVMSGFIESLLEEDDVQIRQLKRSLELMQQQSKRMYRLVEDLMLLSRLENEQQSSKQEIVVVPMLLANLEEEARVLSGESEHTLLFEVDPEVYLRGNNKEIDSIFTNLVVNALNYTPFQGTIRVRWHEDDTGAHFEVHDTGIGIPAHHISRLTERFYRVDVGRSRESGGSGLGLAIVKHALQRHNGKLRIDSEVGRGSTFVCDFPKEIVIHKKAAQVSGLHLTSDEPGLDKKYGTTHD